MFSSFDLLLAVLNHSIETIFAITLLHVYRLYMYTCVCACLWVMHFAMALSTVNVCNVPLWFTGAGHVLL